MPAEPPVSGDALGALLDRVVRNDPGRPFLHRVVGGEVVTTSYAEASGRAGGLLARLSELGVQPGDRVVVHTDDLELSVHLALACFHSGIVPAFVSASFTSGFAAEIAERSGGCRVVTATDLAGVVATAGLPGSPVAAAPTDLCLVQPTSGTTGRPKLVLTPHVSFTFGAAAIFRALPGGTAPRVLLVSSVAHGIGMVSLVGALMHGAALALPETWDVATPRHQVLALEPTFVYTTPRVLRALATQHDAEAAVREPVLGPSVRTVVVAGTQPEVALLERLVDDGVEIHEMYGSSEAGDLAMTPAGAWRPGWIGPAFPGVRLTVADDGELLASTPGRMIGYEGDPAGTAERFTADGAYRTGDVAEIDADGYLRVLGRKIDMINTSEGTNVYPQRIEQLVAAVDGVAQVLVVGEGRPHLGALVVVDEGLDPASPELHERIARELAEVNRGLEPIEQVRAFVLLGQPFDPGSYERVGAGKLRVDRPALERAYASTIAALFAGAPGPDDDR